MTVLGATVLNFSSHSSCLMFLFRHLLSNYCYCCTVFLSVFLPFCNFSWSKLLFSPHNPPFLTGFSSLLSTVTVISPGEEVQSGPRQSHLVLISAQYSTGIPGEQTLCTQVGTMVTRKYGVPEHYVQ